MEETNSLVKILRAFAGCRVHFIRLCIILLFDGMGVNFMKSNNV